MLKLGVSLGLALAVAIITATVGLVQGARPLTVLYRSAVSLIGFFLGGYLAAILAESYVKRRFGDEVKPQGKKVDIISKDGLIENDELLNPSHAAPQFSPFSPENFEKITGKD